MHVPVTSADAGSERVSGSYRDPSGYVFCRGTRLFRAIDDDCSRVLQELHDAGVLQELIDDGVVVPTTIVRDEPLRAELAGDNPPYERFLEHEVIWPITHPYEWSVSMLADAAILTLDLQERLLKVGASLKDATAYNIQFRHGRPIFIDLPSIERPQRLDIWPALGQFGPMFTFPLMLTLYHGWDLRSYFLANLGGLPVEKVGRAIGFLGRCRPRAWLDITIPTWLGRKKVGTQVDTNAVLAAKKTRDSGPQIVNIKRLRAKIRKMAAAYEPSGVWSTYTKTCTYGDEAEQEKQRLVEQFLTSTRPARVLDLGCNTGSYTATAAGTGAHAIAVDEDHDAVELLYRGLRAEPATVTPMVVDVCNPSPAIGFRNRERAAFHDRVRADCVLALALVHHLLVTGNLAPSDVRDLFCDTTEDTLVVEFVPMEDVMFKELLKRRVGPFEEITLERFLEVFAERFELIRSEELPGSKRMLLFMQKRS